MLNPEIPELLQAYPEISLYIASHRTQFYKSILHLKCWTFATFSKAAFSTMILLCNLVMRHAFMCILREFLRLFLI
jgi:hypothetical protein